MTKMHREGLPGDQAPGSANGLLFVTGLARRPVRRLVKGSEEEWSMLDGECSMITVE
jgi:hypothetical protein